ncbi:MAG: hypothetical protein IJM20_01835 [Clostridia bacterium]|nr:hypothetical protein [Clostridia bacterium]
MSFFGIGTETYLYINGIATNRDICIRENVILQPIKTTFDYDIAFKLVHNDIDYAVATVFGRTISSQLFISAPDPKELARQAAFAAWDCVLLGALFCCDVECNLQCDKPVAELAEASTLCATNHHFRGNFSAPYQLNDKDEQWIAAYYKTASDMLDNDSFMTAVHALWSYRWHTLPRVRLAILWAGIESLFDVSSELRFRISLYISNYLYGNDSEKASDLFKKTQKLYDVRSKAVHGAKLKDDISDCVSETAELLNHLIKRCVENGSLPDKKNLVFPFLTNEKR